MGLSCRGEVLVLERFGQAGSGLLSHELESYEQAGLELSHLGHSHVTRSCDTGSQQTLAHKYNLVSAGSVHV